MVVLCAETLGDPYYNKIPLPRIPFICEPRTMSESPKSAAAASAVGLSAL